MEEEKYRNPLFDGNKYPDWKFHMTIYLDEKRNTGTHCLMETNIRTGNFI
jgi:hypothetical protein